MKPPIPKCVGDAWDQAEKLFVERGRSWAVNRRGDKFWIESDDLKVTCTEEDGRPAFVLNLYLDGELLSWQMRWINALDELVTMIDQSAQYDGTGGGSDG